MRRNSSYYTVRINRERFKSSRLQPGLRKVAILFSSSQLASPEIILHDIKKRGVDITFDEPFMTVITEAVGEVAKEWAIAELNRLLNKQDLYKYMEKHPDDVLDLIGQIKNGQTLKDLDLQILNRRLIEEQFPSETPKMSEIMINKDILVIDIHGKNGEVAYVRNDTVEPTIKKYFKLIVELPLSLKSGKGEKSDPRAKWVREAYGFFNQRIASHEEIVVGGEALQELRDEKLEKSDRGDFSRGVDIVDENFKVICKVRRKFYSDKEDLGGKDKRTSLVRKQHKLIYQEFQADPKSGVSNIKKLFEIDPLWEKNREKASEFKEYEFKDSTTFSLIEAIEIDDFKVPKNGSNIKRLNDLLRFRNFSNDLLIRSKKGTLSDNGAVQRIMEKDEKKKFLSPFDIRKVLEALYPDETPKMKYKPMEDTTIVRIGRTKPM